MGMSPQPSSASLERLELELKLKAELDSAADQYQHAKQEYEAALQSSVPESSDPLEIPRTRSALLRLTQTRDRYMARLNIFTELVCSTGIMALKVREP
jgi:hypothetical protein